MQFYTDVLSQHAVLAVTGAPAAMAYLGARFLGSPVPSNCPGYGTSASTSSSSSGVARRRFGEPILPP